MMNVSDRATQRRPVIGVVTDAKDLGVDAGTEPVDLHRRISQRADPAGAHGSRSGIGRPAVRQTVSSLDRNLGVSEVKTMDGVLSDSLARPRLSSLLLGFFALLSVGLAAIGVYGVLAFAARQRVREIGIRMALGAQRAQVLRLFLKEGAMLVGVGGRLGIVAALAVGRLLSAILFDVTPADPLSATRGLRMLVLVGFGAACYSRVAGQQD